MKRIFCFILVALSTAAVTVQAAAPQQLLSFSTYTAMGASIQLAKTIDASGKICTDYVKSVSKSANGTVTIAKTTVCSAL